MPPTTSNQPANGKEGLVNKLQDALAKFRKDRDQLHRSKELALERNRLIKAEEEALSKTVQTMRDKHNHLVGQTANIESRMGPLEAKVRSDTKEMQFQHAELLGARAKIQQLNNQLEDTSKRQQKRLQQAQQLVCDLRSRQGSRSLSTTDSLVPSVKDQIRGLKKEMDHNIDFMDALSKAMDESIRQMQSKVQFYRIQSNRMEEQMGLIAPHHGPEERMMDAEEQEGGGHRHHHHHPSHDQAQEGGNQEAAMNPSVIPVAASVHA